MAALHQRNLQHGCPDIPLLLKYMETNVFYIITTVFVVFGLLLLTFSTPIQKEK